MKRFAYILISVLLAPVAVAQSYSHDATKQNQITVQELGEGNLTPEFYYWLLHNSYRNTAAARNKLGFRTTAGLGAYEQIDDAEKMDSAMVKRAEVEALNVADRTGGAADLAWMAEGKKITDKMAKFHANINRIVPAGGSAAQYRRWKEVYNVLNTAVKSTQDAYMPNAQRKKEYLRIYAELLRQNELLVTYLSHLQLQGNTAELLAASPNEMPDCKGTVANEAYTRWRGAAFGNYEDDDGDGTGGWRRWPWIWTRDSLIHYPDTPTVTPTMR